jgi:hypothetical protein
VHRCGARQISAAFEKERAMIPEWITTLSVAMLSVGALCSMIIVIDLLMGHQQHMWIMNIVWPVAALFGTIVAVWGYFKYGRLATQHQVMAAKERGEEPPNKTQTPFPVMVAKGAAHCGSGCTLGDICAEFLALAFPLAAAFVGWKWLFPDTHAGKMYSVWILDYLFALGFGVAFQYFTIVPMRGLPLGKGLWQAFKADILSLTAWQVGMYSLMAAANLGLFMHVWHTPLRPNMPEFWATMQLAMIAGFITSYPVNWWLIRSGIKEAM